MQNTNQPAPGAVPVSGPVSGPGAIPEPGAPGRAGVPRAHKAYVEVEHGERSLAIPRRRVHLTNGERLDLYDTSGPQGHDAERGLPKLRHAWVEDRLHGGF